jgi:hypothetical protein
VGRPRKVKYEIEERFLADALRLAESFSGRVMERDTLKALLDDTFEYTEDMAIQDLIGGGVQYGERVQTSNISNVPERIAILLDEGYVEKQRCKMRQEAEKHKKDYQKYCAEIEIVETAMQERMDARTRAVFRCLYIEHRPWSKVRDEVGNHLEKKAVLRCKQKEITAIAEELMLVEHLKKLEDQ